MEGMLCREVQGTKRCCAEVRKRLNFKNILLPLASPPHRESTTSNALCSTLQKKNALFMRTLLITFQKTTVSGVKLVHSGLSLRNKLTLLLVVVSGKNVL